MMAFLEIIYLKLLQLIGKVAPIKGVPVLLYHSISNDDSLMSVSARNFEKQLSLLKSAGYSSVSPLEMFTLGEKKKWPHKKVMITFDDGFKDNYELAAPLLKKYDFSAVFFITGRCIDGKADFCTNNVDAGKPMMSADDIKKMSDDGFEIANHFFSHQELLDLSDEKISEEYQKNLFTIKQIIGSDATLRYVAYPRNKKGDIGGLLDGLGVKLAFGGKPGVVTLGCDRYDLPRVQVFNRDSDIKFMARLSGYHYLFSNFLTKVKSFINSPWLYAIFGLIFMRLIFFIGGLMDFPAGAGLVGSWWTTYGGDEVGYFSSAHSLMTWDFYANIQPIGFSLFLIPFIWLTSAQKFIDIFPLMSFVNSVILYSTLSIGIYLLAKEVLWSKFKALIIVLIFNIYPYLFYFLFKFGVASNEIIDDFVISRFRQLMFWHVGSDPLAATLLIFALLLVLAIVNKSRYAPWWSMLLGIAVSWSVIARLQNIVLLPFYFFILLLFKRVRWAMYFMIFSLPLMFLHFYVNFISRGSILASTYSTVDDPSPFMSWQYLDRIITYPLNYGPILFIPLVALLFLVVLGAVMMIKKNKTIGLILVAYVVVNFIFIIFLEPTFRNPRYFLPIIPIVFIALYFPVDWFIKNIIQYAKTKRKINTTDARS